MEEETAQQADPKTQIGKMLSSPTSNIIYLPFSQNIVFIDAFSFTFAQIHFCKRCLVEKWEEKIMKEFSD